MRLSFARGGRLIFAWTRSRPEEVTISLGSSSTFEDWAFLGLFAIPAVIALIAYLSVAMPSGGRVSAFVVLLLYMPLQAVFTVPCLLLLLLMRAKNKDVLQMVESAVRAKIGG